MPDCRRSPASPATGLAFGYPPVASAVLAIAMGVTSIGIRAQGFLDLNCHDTRYGLHVIGAAVTIRGGRARLVFVATRGPGCRGSAVQYARVLGFVAAFFLAGVVVRRILIEPMPRVLARSRQPGADLIGIMGILFLFGYAAEAAELDAIVGGLVAGLIVGAEKRFREVEIREGIAGSPTASSSRFSS